jgi:hypothetical protein
MNRLQMLARIMLVGMGLFIAINSLPQLIMTFQMFIFTLRASDSARTWGIGSPSLIALFVSPIYLCAGLYFLVYKSRSLALKIAPYTESDDTSMTPEWLPTAYRLVCVGTGLFFLYSTFWQIISLLNNLSFYRQYQGSASPVSITKLLGLGMSLAIGLYLITGAPHFVQWHVRKTQTLFNNDIMI